MSGTTGDDVIQPLNGDDFVDGGPGNDFVFIDNSTGPVIIDLVAGTASGPQSGNDTLRNIEYVLADGGGNVTIIGSDKDEILRSYSYGSSNISGGNGDDIVSDAGFNSVLDGGSGRNLVGLYLTDYYDNLGNRRPITTPFTHNFTPGISGTLGNGTTYSNFGYFILNTGSGDDTVTFNNLLQRPSSQSYFGNEWSAGGGNDTVTVDMSGSSTSLNLNQQSTPLFAILYGSTGEVIRLLGVENYRIIGGSANDRFTGGAGGDVFTANGGNDTLDGGEGPDLARYSGLSSDYRVDKLSSTSYKVTDLRSGTPDGADTVTNIERLQWGDGSVTVLFNSPPTLLTHDSDQMPGQSLALSSLLTVSDVDGNAMTRYQLWDGTRDSNSGYFVVNGIVQAAGSVIDIAASQLGQTFFVTGAVDDDLQIRAYDGDRWSAADTASWSPFTITIDNPPAIFVHDMHVAAGQTFAATDLFSDGDVDGDFRSRYQLWDSTQDPNSGHWIVNGVVQAAGTVIDITAAQLSQTTFVTGTVDDDLQVRVFDGTFWSAPDTAAWSPFQIGPHVNRAPNFAFPNPVSKLPGQSIALSSIISATDIDGDTITRYQFWDSTRDPNSGYFVVNGVAKAAGTIIDVSAAELSQTFFIAGRVSDSIQGRDYDGKAWSFGDNDAWAQVTITVPANRAPVVSTSNLTRSHLQTLSASSLFLVNDPDGDAITRYQLWDSTSAPQSGHFVVNGAVKPAGTVIDITAAELAQTSFVTGAIGDSLQIRAFDGIDWSAAATAPWSTFTITVPANTAPSLHGIGGGYSHGEIIALSNLISVSDGNGDPITKYQLWDSTADPASGHWVVDGVVQPAGKIIEVTAAQAGQAYFVTGVVGDNLQARAFDGIDWSAADNAAWSPFSISTAPYTAPVVTTANVQSPAGQTLALSSLFSVFDPDGDPVRRYQLWDSNRDASSGHFVVNGVIQAAGTIIEVAAADLSQTSFVTGTVDDSLQIRVFDGISWSAADNASWAPFTAGPTAHVLPVVNTTGTTLFHGDVVALSTLASVTLANGNAITRYQLWDGSSNPASGHFIVNGVAQLSGTVIDITAADFAQSSFAAGTPTEAMGVLNDNLQIRAFDGTDWSAADNAPWAPFTVQTNANHAPTLAPTPPPGVIGGFPNTSIDLSDMLSLINMADADGDAITRVQLWDSTANPFSGHWSINGIAQQASTVIDIDASEISQVSFDTGRVSDNLQIRVFDGIDWSAADNAAWSPFTFTVTNHAPAVGTSSPTPEHGRTLLPSDLFFVGDGDGDTITRYQLWDSTRDPDSGHFVVNGQVQAAGTIIDLTPAQLAQTVFVTGKVSDSLQVRAFDGLEWSAADDAPWSPFAVTVTPYTPPSLTTQDVNTTPGQTMALSSLFSVSDPDGDTMTRYQLWDSTADPNSGHFVVNGQDQAASTVIDITAAQFAQTSFLTGTVGDSLQIRAFDGISWSAADTAAWAPFHINV